MTDNSNGASAGDKYIWRFLYDDNFSEAAAKDVNAGYGSHKKKVGEFIELSAYDALRAQCKELVEGLEFYARPIDYLVHHSMGYGLSRNENNMSRMEADSGNLARSILSKFKDSVGG